MSDFPVFDIAVFGEGEETMLELSKKYFQNLDTIQGIAYRKNKDILINPNRPFLSLDNLPQIDWTGSKRALYYPVFTSRGCAYRCIFCARPFGGRVRYRPLQQVFEEIKQVTESYHPKLIYFWDENFTLDRKRTQELLELIKADHVTKII